MYKTAQSVGRPGEPTAVICGTIHSGKVAGVTSIEAAAWRVGSQVQQLNSSHTHPQTQTVPQFPLHKKLTASVTRLSTTMAKKGGGGVVRPCPSRIGHLAIDRPLVVSRSMTPVYNNKNLFVIVSDGLAVRIQKYRPSPAHTEVYTYETRETNGWTRARADEDEGSAKGRPSRQTAIRFNPREEKFHSFLPKTLPDVGKSRAKNLWRRRCMCQVEEMLSRRDCGWRWTG
ncbi:hypothetical protein TESG_03701 [Trichophyton tonsurans CBS 112818]|uniref:Uncharacterized protein n=1 Tax=Trichophyton tonsurans (strain CBS 112818) TaxID=647933 RepID=F2RY17_TRIT1|nr:hypothetical protein TESG_03701 [Trichophyton tonsurans CBS 112818]